MTNIDQNGSPKPILPEISAEKPARVRKVSKNRRKSRELVLKALYQREMNVQDVLQMRRDATIDPDFNHADAGYFKALLEGICANIEALDAKIAGFIDRKLEELSPIEHAILRVSAYELIFDMSIPYKVAINEGVELAKMYGGTDGHKYVNGVLDKIAADARPNEFKR